MRKKTIIAICLALALSFILASCGSSGNGEASDNNGASNNSEAPDNGEASDDDGGSLPAVAISSPADFAGHSIACQSGTTASDSIHELNEAGNIDVSEYEQITQCFDDLKIGRVDAVYVDSVVASYYVKDNNAYKNAWLSDTPEPMGICIGKDNEKLAAAIEACIDTMYFDGSMAQIAAENFDSDYTASLRNVTEEPTIATDFTTLTPGTLKVGFEATYPPMEYTTEDGTEFIGFDVDVSKKLGELLGVEVEFVNTTFDGIFAGLEKGDYDCIISAISITPERQEKYNMTKPYVANALCIVTRNG
jgi:ABC-type amino acid transport substrate-binding protein